MWAALVTPRQVTFSLFGQGPSLYAERLTDSNNFIAYCRQHVISSVFVSIIHFHAYFLVFLSTPLISVTISRARQHQEILRKCIILNNSNRRHTPSRQHFIKFLDLYKHIKYASKILTSFTYNKLQN
jgi:hypothetical protein